MAHHPIRRLVLAGFAAACVLAAPVFAQQPPATPAQPLSADDKALVDRAADYLGSLDEAKGHFVQTDQRGAVSQGALYLKRPGLARFAYDPPSSGLVVSDGFNVPRVDPRLKTFDRAPLGSTPLALFLGRDVRLDRGVQITHVVRFSDGFSLTVRDARHPNNGSLTLTFADAPMKLREWSLADAQGQTTRVRITDLERASGLDPALFVLHDPRPARAGGGGGHP